MQNQRRGRRIAMSPDELNQFLTETKVCRVGTARLVGGPHVTPLWFVWDGTSIWLNSTTSSRRLADIVMMPRISVLVDAGEEYSELHGAELLGDASVVGESPRVGMPVSA